MAVGESWAEIDISIFERGCLSRPVADAQTLEQRVSALVAERNARHATIDWQFTARQALVKLKKLAFRIIWLKWSNQSPVPGPAPRLK